MAWQNTFSNLIWPVVDEDHVVNEALLGLPAKGRS